MNMDINGLRSYLIKLHCKEIYNMRDEISDSLQLSPDQAKLVFNVIQSFYELVESKSTLSNVWSLISIPIIIMSGVSFVKLDYIGLMKLGNDILSEGIHIKNLILNDLYYHLQGEVEERDIEHGAFKELSRFFSSSNLLQIYQKKCVNDYSAGANNAYLFDLWRHQRDIGLYFWDCSEWKALKKIAENTLFYVQRANSMHLILSSSSQRCELL